MIQELMEYLQKKYVYVDQKIIIKNLNGTLYVLLIKHMQCLMHVAGVKTGVFGWIDRITIFCVN